MTQRAPSTPTVQEVAAAPLATALAVTASGQPPQALLGLALTQPVVAGREAHRRLVLSTTAPPAAGQPVTCQLHA